MRYRSVLTHLAEAILTLWWVCNPLGLAAAGGATGLASAGLLRLDGPWALWCLLVPVAVCTYHGGEWIWQGVASSARRFQHRDAPGTRER